MDQGSGQTKAAVHAIGSMGPAREGACPALCERGSGAESAGRSSRPSRAVQAKVMGADTGRHE